MNPPRLPGISRIHILSLLLAAACASMGRAEEPLQVLRPDEAPREMLGKALRAQIHELLEKRKQDVAALKTPEAVKQRQEKLRALFFEALGDLPEKTPLNARVVGEEKRDGYRVERVVYESRPGHHVTAALYLPDAKGPVPGVLVPCGHSANGKAGGTYQQVCHLMAKNGLAVLCYDPVGQGERLQLLNDQGKAAIAGSTTEHTMSGIGSLLVGRCLAAYRIWDGFRSMDYLASRPEVDPDRLGCTGNSGGGTLTAYLMALDPRISVAVPSCYITSLDRLFATIGPQDAEQNIPGQVAFGLDHADFAILRAPKPTLFSVGTRDFFDIQGSWDTFREVKLIYGRLGYGERMDLFESDEPHGFTSPRRVAATRWLRRWLLKIDDAIVEQEFTPVSDDRLQVTKSGQVLSEFQGKSVFDLNIERAEELAKARQTSSTKEGKATLLRQVRKLIGLAENGEPAQREDRGKTNRSGLGIEKLVYTTEQGIQIPALRITPEKPATGARLAIVVGDDSWENLLANSQVESLLREGRAVLLPALRGMGETAPSTKVGAFGADEREAFLGLHLNRPLLGQRTGDLLAVIAKEVNGSDQQVDLVGLGQAGPIALHAAALDEKVNALKVVSAITSWSDVVKTPKTRGQLGNTVPGALASYDLPDLAASITPRKLEILAPVDPNGLPLAMEEAAETYRVAKEAYREGKSVDQFSIEPGPPLPTRHPLVRAVDLKVGESQEVRLSNDQKATVKLIAVEETRDPIRQAVRGAKVKVEVNGKEATLGTGNYHLPVVVGRVQVDCPVTGGYPSNSGENGWGIEKDARIRLWPARSPWIEPATFSYPVGQRWFATYTQMANEPVYVDGGEKPDSKKIYYHTGLDIGGAEGMVEVRAATDGVVVSSGTTLAPGFENTPARPRYDVVYLLDDQGWYYRYSHMLTIDPAIKVGAKVKQGQKLGVLGKEGASGGWSHLHFEIKSRQPSGKWGTQEGYAFLWQAALRQQAPSLVAVARPHHLIWSGERVTLDSSKSWAKAGRVSKHEWSFDDGTKANGAKVERTYEKPGVYAETLKVTDREGRVDYDFAVVQVLDRANPNQLPPTIHAAFMPTSGIQPGQKVTFKVRTFRTTHGEETWDFGDGSPTVTAHSDGTVKALAKDGYAVTTHQFEKPGHYIVRVERSNPHGAKATAKLHVVVKDPNSKTE